MLNVDAIVVTYNRLDKLKECLSSLSNIKLRNVFVVNNNSSDGTKEYLQNLKKNMNNLIVFNLDENIGGAGGFNIGMKKFIEKSNSEYVWIMDDDTIPSVNSLDNIMKEFLNMPFERQGFAIGQTYWTDGTLTRMNKPIYSNRDYGNNPNIRLVDQASFVAIVFSRNAILKVGYPISDFFIWGDDVEYTSRIRKSGFEGIQVMNASIIHKMGSNNSTDIINENSDEGRINRHFYDFRNRLYLSKNNGTISLIKTLIGRIIWLLKIIFLKNNFKVLKIKTLIKGTIAGLKFKPKIENANSLNKEWGR